MLEAILDSLAHILIAVVIFFCFLLFVTWVVRQLICTSDRKRLQNAKKEMPLTCTGGQETIEYLSFRKSGKTDTKTSFAFRIRYPFAIA